MCLPLQFASLTEAPTRAGFLTKVKKIVESICVLCGKLKGSPHLDPRLAEAVRFIRDPKKRLAVVHSLVKTKNVCEMDVVEEEGQVPDGTEVVKGHGGCGHSQPLIRREGLKLFMVYGKGKDEVRSIRWSSRRRDEELTRRLFVFAGRKPHPTRPQASHRVHDPYPPPQDPRSRPPHPRP
mgnify:FL=1